MSNITEKVKQIVEYEKDIAAGIEEIKQFLESYSKIIIHNMLNDK